MDHAMGEAVAPVSKETTDTDGMTESIVSMMGGLSIGDCGASFKALVSGWIATAERTHRGRVDFSKTVGDLVLGKEPITEEDWQEMLEKIYGSSLKYLLLDSKTVDNGADGCPAESRGLPRAAKIFDWLQRSEAGFLDYAPMLDWVEVCYDHYLQERILVDHIALGVGTHYAAIIARKPKEKLYTIYYCELSDVKHPVCANNIEVGQFKEVSDEVGLEHALKDKMQGDVYAYKPSLNSFKEVPDSGFVSGDHLVLYWPNHPTADGHKDKIGIYTLPHCYTTNGQNQDGSEKILCHQLECPPMSIGKICLLYPLFLFVTTTSWFNKLSLLRRTSNFEYMSTRLKEMKEKELGADKQCDLIVAVDLESKFIYRVIPIKEGNVSYLGTYPRMTCPTDLLVDKQSYKIVWNVTNVSKPQVHGCTEYEQLLLAKEGDPEIKGVRGFYWSDPLKELSLSEQYTKKNVSPPVETPRGIYLYPGDHIVQISENNLSTFVAKHGKLFPENALYHARDVKVTDCLIHGNTHVTVTSAGEIQFSPLRAVSGDLVPRYTFNEDKLAKMGRRPPKAATSLSRDWRSKNPDPGHYKAIWVSPSFRFVVQLHNGTLVFFRPRTLEELKDYLEKIAKARAEEEIRKRSKAIAEHQLAEASASGKVPEHIHKAKEESESSNNKMQS